MHPAVLIADGDTELLDVYRRYLGHHGYEVETATDGLQCLDKLRRAAPAVVVLDRDLQWGGCDGVLAWLREERAAGAQVVVTAATGPTRPRPGDLVPPVAGVLSKPFTLAALLEAVRAAAAGRADAYERLEDSLPAAEHCCWGQ